MSGDELPDMAYACRALNDSGNLFHYRVSRPYQFGKPGQLVHFSICSFLAGTGPLGLVQAFVATAHRIARTVYFMLKHKTPYHDVGAQGYEEQRRERELRALRRKAAKLGFALQPRTG